MRTIKGGILSAAILGLGLAAPAAADPDEDQLILNGETEIATEAPAPEHLGGVLGSTIYSGWRFRTDETQALQADDFDNPAMLAIDAAVEMFNTPMGTEGKSCANCHESPEAFAGFATSMPKVVDGKVLVMEDLLNSHMAEVMGAEPMKWSSQPLQNLVALIRHQSRGMPMNVAVDGDAAPFYEQGKEMYYTRYGQLELSCANCHEDNWGRMIRADHLSMGQTNGFPTYRLRNTALVSVHNRFRGCIRDTRAETFAEGSDEFKALELYVASRGNGLSIESPAVRQ